MIVFFIVFIFVKVTALQFLILIIHVAYILDLLLLIRFHMDLQFFLLMILILNFFFIVFILITEYHIHGLFFDESILAVIGRFIDVRFFLQVLMFQFTGLKTIFVEESIELVFVDFHILITILTNLLLCNVKNVVNQLAENCFLHVELLSCSAR